MKNKSGIRMTDEELERGFSRTRLYQIYHKMIGRCTKKYCKNYNNYGMRGIKVCKEWKESYFAFYKWAMNNGYNDNLTIDRIDSNGNYEPNNCRWVTYKVQNNNRRSNVYFTYNGERRTMKEWSELLNIPYITIQRRYYRFGNNPDKIFSKENYKDLYIEYQGKRLPLIEWADITGIDRNILYKRIKEFGWSTEKAFTTPKGALTGKNGMKKVICKETGIIYESIAEAGREIQRQESNIKACCIDKRKTCGGYHWGWYNGEDL